MSSKVRPPKGRTWPLVMRSAARIIAWTTMRAASVADRSRPTGRRNRAWSTASVSASVTAPLGG
ncbi:hypothetical protein [Streptomyces yanii]|uniref:Uncharacterized protein n=1 Tax=Streptomyces yanii TaxID=78510 RepID=A0ABV5RJM8_9ACTN